MAASTSVAQPIIRGIQSVGSVGIYYQYNGNGNKLLVNQTVFNFKAGDNSSVTEIDTTGGLSLAGFRLDSEFLRANQQIASSIVIPILGGGGVALTNNNRTGTLSINCTKVSVPNSADNSKLEMTKGAGMGPVDGSDVYDLVTIAQIQQAQPGGDSSGATVVVAFNFCDITVAVEFQGVTVANVDPLALTGNDAASYNVQLNYLNWTMINDVKDGFRGGAPNSSWVGKPADEGEGD